MERKPVPPAHKVPLILKKKNMTILKNNFVIQKVPPQHTKKIATFREDVLYETSDVHFLKGEYQRLTLVNRMNVITKCSRTIARYISAYGTVFEKTSDTVSQIIGQEQYKTVFTGLCSILDQELKIRSILALLTSKSIADEQEKLVVNNINNSIPKECMEKSCQTDEMRLHQLKQKPRRINRKRPGPYIIQDKKLEHIKNVKKVVYNILNTDSNASVTCEKNGYNCTKDSENEIQQLRKKIFDVDKEVPSKRNSIDSWPDLGHLDDEYSNHSIALSTLSETPTLPDLLTNPASLLNNVDEHTKDIVDSYIIRPNHKVQLMDGTEIMVLSKPEDIFHIATKENLMSLDPLSKMKLLSHQMKIDHKHCLTVLDDDGNLPIHMAVLNNDLELLNRQCVVLKLRGTSVDIPAADGLTALMMSLFQEGSVKCEMTSLLLRHGADALHCDSEHRTALHCAADRDSRLLRTILETCSENARNILMENEDLWKPEMEQQSDDELAQILMKHMCSMFDKQGYTPLMLASMSGLYENVRVLLKYSPNSVNDKMPTSGNTALYLAVAAACNSSAANGNKSKVLDHFRNTIQILLENGAVPAIDNHCGTSVNTLLMECESSELSMLVANEFTKANLRKNQIPQSSKPFEKNMFIKDKEGNIAYKSLKNENRKRGQKKIVAKSKPEILENILLKPGNTDQKLSTSAANSSNDSKKSIQMNSSETDPMIVNTESTQVNKVVKYSILTQTTPKKDYVLPEFLKPKPLKRQIVIDVKKTSKQPRIDK